MIGPGKYDDLCSLVREKTNAKGVMLIVAGGNLGTGFSAQFTTEDLALGIPSALRQMADQIENDSKRRN